MENLESIVRDLQEKLKKYGINAYAIAIDDPDSDLTHFMCGNKGLWQIGAATQLTDFVKNYYNNAQDEDEHGDSSFDNN